MGGARIGWGGGRAHLGVEGGLCVRQATFGESDHVVGLRQQVGQSTTHSGSGFRPGNSLVDQSENTNINLTTICKQVKINAILNGFLAHKPTHLLQENHREDIFAPIQSLSFRQGHVISAVT